MIKRAYYFIYTCIYSGWFFHQSTQDFFLGYSQNYLIFLIILLLPFSLPTILIRLKKLLGKRKFKNISIFSTLIFFALYFLSSQFYYYSQTYLFDPFLQIASNPVPAHITQDKKGAFRILCLGGSTTLNRRLSEDHKYPSQLQKKLQSKYPNRKIEVINGGMDFYTTKHSLINFVTYYQSWDPDLIVVMHGVNDLLRSFNPITYSYGAYHPQWTHYYGAAIRGANPPTFEKFWSDYFFYNVQEAWFSSLRFRKVAIPLEKFYSIPDFKRNLNSLIRNIQQNGTPLLLVTQPFLFKKIMSKEEQGVLWMTWEFCRNFYHVLRTDIADYPSMTIAMDEISNSTKEAAINFKTYLCDAEKYFPKDLQHFRDDVHYTPNGAERLAHLISEKITEEKLIGH